MPRILTAAASVLLLAGPAFADPAPAAGSMPLSQILAKVEQRPDFGHVKDIEWDGGLYEVEYRTKDGGTREVKLDPRTGEPRGK